MNWRRVVLPLLAMLVAQTALAVGTRGSVTCDQWLADRKANAWEITADQFWLLGYLSGLAVGLDEDILNGATTDAVFSWMDSYCVTHAAKGVGDAANAYARELIDTGDPKK